MAVSQTQLTQLYLAYFGRPPDFDGLVYYTSNPNFDIWTVAAGFSASPESQALYAGSLSAQINAIYQNLFNRDAEPAGLLYWSQEIVSGRLSAAGAAYGILLGAQNEDLIAVNNKMAASAAFVAAMDTSAEIVGYSGNVAAATARAWLHTVDSSAASLTTALAGVDVALAAVVAGGTIVEGIDITLTTAVDNTPGTAGNDTFRAAWDGTGTNNVSTWSAGDNIAGGAGVDTFEVVLTDDFWYEFAPVLDSIETLSIRAANDDADTFSFDASAAADLNTIVLHDFAPSNNLSLTIDNLQQIVNVSASNLAKSDSVSIDLSFDASVETGESEAFTVTLSNVGDLTDTTTASGAFAEDFSDINYSYSFSFDTYELTTNVVQTTAEGGTVSTNDFIDHLNIVSAGAANVLYLDDGFGEVDHVTVTGGGDLYLSVWNGSSAWNAFNELQSFNASAMTGNLYMDWITSDVSGTIDIAFGSGSDVWYGMGADFASVINVSLGEGDNRLDYLTGTTGAEISLTAGSGDDIVDYVYGGLININLGSGDDTLWSASATDTLNVDMGAGADFYYHYTSAAVATVAMGAGDDIVDMTGGYFNYTVDGAVADAYDGGTGMDTLVIYAGDFTTTNVAAFSSFEKLGVMGNGTYDASLLDGITELVIGADGNALSGDVFVTDVGNAITTLTISENFGAATYTADIAAATDGTANSIAVAINAGTAGMTQGVLALDDYETVALSSNGGANTITALNSTDLKTLTITGTAALTVSGGSVANVTSIDASGLAGNLNLTGLAASFTKAVTFQGGSKVDTFTGSALADTLNGNAGNDVLDGAAGNDTLNGGAGNDMLTGGVGIDVLTGGAGNDTFVLSAPAASNNPDTVTDASAGDKLSFVDWGTEVFTAAKLTSVVEDYTNLINAATSGDGSANATIKWFQFGGNTYVVEDLSAASTYQEGTDVVVKLTGLVDLADSTLVGNVLTIV